MIIEVKHWLEQANINRKHPELDGKDMPNYFEREDFEKIIKHNVDDLTTSEKLFKFLKKMNPQLIPFG